MFKALLLDDERPQREGIARHVRWGDYGFNTPILCANGWEAIEQFRKEHVDVLLTDICMPGKDGLETMTEAQALQKDLFVVVISGFADFLFAQKALHNGAREYLLKPVKPQEIHRVLASFLNWRATRFVNGVEIQPDGPVAEITRILEDHVSDGITLYLLAETVHMNESYLCTLYKKECGETIQEALTRMQRDRACAYLATSSLSVKEIAYQTGGRTASNFAQWFRKQVGVSPLEYRRITKESGKE